MKVLLLSTKNNSFSLPVVPIGMLYIAEALKRNNYDYKMVDLNFYSNIEKKVSEEIDVYAPDIVGMSIRNVAEGEQMNQVYEQIARLAKIIQGRAKLLLGGAGFSIFPKVLMELTDADIGIIGAGETAIIQAINNLNKMRHGILLSAVDKSFVNSDISLVVKEYWEKYGKFFVLSQPTIPIQATRGCTQRCRYCTYPVVSYTEIQKRDINCVINEIESIIKYTRISNFYFVDSVFNLDLEYTKALLKKIVERQLHIRWSCALNPISFDYELIDLIKDAGCVHCDLGVDSFSDIRLKELNKDFNCNQALELITAVEGVGINYSISLILGGYGETVTTLMDTYKTANKLKKVEEINAFIGERIYPKTVLAQILSADSEKDLYWASEKTRVISKYCKDILGRIVKNSSDKKWCFLEDK